MKWGYPRTGSRDRCPRTHRDADIPRQGGEAFLFPGFKELYLRGKEISQKGESVYILKPYQTDGPAGYFSIDLIVIETIKIYEKLGVPTDSLRRYLANKNKKLNTPFEKEQFYRDQYFAQMASGMILAGILVYPDCLYNREPVAMYQTRNMKFMLESHRDFPINDLLTSYLQD